MFTESLLVSSPSRGPLLTVGHRWVIFLAGTMGFVYGIFFWPFRGGMAGAEVTLLRAMLAGAVLAVYALGGAYVYADARNQGLAANIWCAAFLLLNVAGLLAYLAYSAQRTGDWKRVAVPLAYTLQAFFLSILILIPLIKTEALPNLGWRIIDAPSPPPSGGGRASTPSPKHVRRLTLAELLRTPAVIPRDIGQSKASGDEIQAGADNFAPSIVGVPGAGMDGVPFSLPSAANVPPPPLAKKAPAPQGPVRVISRLEEAKLIFSPKPEYPALAKMARIQGTVRLEAVISEDGLIEQLRLISGHPLLAQAAMDAVKLWRYEPTLLNGKPVVVLTEIDVIFELGE